MDINTLFKLVMLPWLVVLPFAFYLMLRQNYRKCSGLCVKCGVPDTVRCDKKECEEAYGFLRKNKLFQIVFTLWVFGSIGWARHMIMIG